MAGVVETVSLKLDLKGFEQIQGLGNKFKALENPVRTTATGVTQVINEVKRLAGATRPTIASLNAQADALTRVRQTAEIGSQEFRELTNEILRVKGALDQASASMNKAKFGGGTVKKGLGVIGGAAAFGGPVPGVTGLAGGLMSSMRGGDFLEGASAGVGVGFAAKPVIDAIGGTAEYAADYSKAQLTLEQITKDAGSYGVAMEAVRTAVEEFNVPQEVAIQGMTRLSAAVLGSGGNVNNAAEAFLNVTAAIKGTAGSADDVKSAITAMVQIYSKGKVSAEELSGQLGERFPGAVVKFAEANNISAQSLQKNLKDGTVGLDMLSKFITSLGTEYIPLAKKIAASNEEAGARATVAMNKLRIAVGDNLKDVGAQFQIIGANILIDIIPALQSIAEIGANVFGALAAVVKLVANNFDILGPVIVGTTVALTLYNIQVQIANKSGLVGMLRNVVAIMIKLRRALVLATIAQNGFNLSTLKNKWIMIAAAITAAVTALVNWRKTVAEVKEGESILGDITGMDLKATEKKLVEIRKKVKDLQDQINNPNTASGEKKGLDQLLERYQNGVAELETRITKLGGKVLFEKWEKDSKKGASPFAKFTEDLEKFDEGLANIAVNGFKKLEDTIMEFVTTGKLAFKDLVTSVLHELTRLAIQETVTKPLFGIFKKALGIGLEAAIPGAGGITSGIGPVANAAAYGNMLQGASFAKQVSDIMTNTAAPINSTITGGGAYGVPKGLQNLELNAMGNAFAKNGIVPYYKGGVVGNPTMFKYGGSQLGIMGEAGPEAILPLQRGRGGRLGVAMQGGGGGTTNVNYTGPTLNFNGDEYVPKSAVGSIVNAAANEGANRGRTATLRSLQNNRSSRSRIGM